MPALVAVNTAGWAITLDGRHRWFSIVFGCLCVAVPALLEVIGVVEPSYLLTSEGMVVVPRALDLSKNAILMVLIVAALSTVVTCSLSVTRIRDSLRQTEGRLYVQNWQIAQLAPAPTRPGGRPHK
jgi:hypothetical protein